MQNGGTTIKQLNQLIDQAKRLKREIERSMAEISKLIETAEALKQRGKREIHKTPRTGQKGQSS